MSAQLPEGDSATAGHGGLRERTPLLPESGTVNGSRAAEGGISRDSVQENPNLHDPAPSSVPTSVVNGYPRTSLPEVPGSREPPYQNLPLPHAEVSASRSMNNPERDAWDSTRSLTPVTSAVQLHEFFSAGDEHAHIGEPVGMRWVTRFTEFLRTTVNRGATGMDRVLEGFRVPSRPVPQVSEMYGFGGQSSEITPRRPMLNFSPPEELYPQGQSLPPIPTSWATAQTQPLFNEGQVSQMRQARRDHPLLYGQASSTESEHSSRLQAEVQRQLEEYTVKYQENLRQLQGEVEQLRRERTLWEAQGKQALEPQGNLQSHLPQGGPRELPQAYELPRGNDLPLPRARELPRGNGSQLPQASELPRGNGSQLPQASELPRGNGSQLPQASELPRGNGSQLPQASDLPRGDGSQLPRVQEPTQSAGPRATRDSPSRPRDSPQVLQASDGSLRQDGGIPHLSAQVTSGDGGVENASGNQAFEPRGNLQSHLPQGGPQIYSSGAVSGGPHGESQNDTAGESKNEGDKNGTTAQQWLGGPATPDPMTLIAGGVKELSIDRECL